MADYASPDFKKYHMLFKLHLPEGAVMQKMAADGLDDDVIEGFIDFVASGGKAGGTSAVVEDGGGRGVGGGGNGLTYAMDPLYAKYFKMLSMHLPRGAVEQKMVAEGVDPSILDTPDAPSPNSTGPAAMIPTTNATSAMTSGGSSGLAGGGAGLRISERSVGGSAQQLSVGREQFILFMMQSHGLINIGDNDSVPSLGVTYAPSATADAGTFRGGGGGGGGVPALKLKDDKMYEKFFKMLRMHLPRGAVEQKMVAEGHDPEILDMDPEGPSPNSPDAGDDGDGDDAPLDLSTRKELDKYRTMQKLHLPEGAIEQKMRADGIDEDVIDVFFSSL